MVLASFRTHEYSATFYFVFSLLLRGSNVSLNELCTNSHLYRDGTGFRANARSSLDNLSVVGSHSMHSLETLINARRGASTSVLSIDKLKYDEVRKVDPIAYLTQVSEFRICLRSLSFVHFSRLVSCSSFSPPSLSLSLSFVISLPFFSLRVSVRRSSVPIFAKRHWPSFGSYLTR